MNNAIMTQQKEKKSLINDEILKSIESFFYGIMAASIAVGVLYVFASFKG